MIIFTLLLAFSYNGILSAQSYGGTPYIASFIPPQYGASLQNWDIAQDQRGVLYFANNDGMLSFDGNHWQTYPLPNRTVMRSVEIGPYGLVYCGGQNEFGRFQPNSVGKWEYQSLLDSIPEPHRNFDDVWDICVEPDIIAFRSAGKIFYSFKGQWVVYDTLSFQFLAAAGEEIIGQSIDGILYSLRENIFQPIAGAEQLRGSLIIGAAPFQGGYILATEHQGLYAYKNEVITPVKTSFDDFLAEHVMTKISTFGNGDLVIGTTLGGLLIVDQALQIKHHIHVENGLLNNNVMSILVSNDQHVWAASSKGINFIETNSPFTYIKPDGALDGIGYAAAIQGKRIYIGTNNGLFYSELISGEKQIEDLGRFKPVPGTKGQVWGLNIIDQELILSHQKGAFVIRNGIAEPFYEENGVWMMQKELIANDTYLLGTYNGINKVIKRNGQFIIDDSYTQMNESSRFIVQDGLGTIWMAHPYKGIYRITKTADGQWHDQLCGPDLGLPSFLHNHVFAVHDKVIFCPESGVYEFNTENNTFTPYPPLNELLGKDIKIRRLFEDAGQNIWYITDKEVGILLVEDIGLEKKITKKVFPGLKEKLHTGWEFIYPYDDQNVFIASTDGFIHYDPSLDYLHDSSAVVLIREVRTIGRQDSVLFSGTYYDGKQILFSQPENETKSLLPAYNTLQFQFGTTRFSHQDEMLYRYQLDNFDVEWSDWTTQQMKEYTRLDPGKYTFRVQAMTRNALIKGETQYQFEIANPWYTSLMAWVSYGLVGFMGVMGIFYFNKRKIIRLEEVVEQTVNESRSTIERIENERIAEQLEIKKRELITSTMHLIQKNETMEELKNRLSEISSSCRDETAAAAIRKMIQRVERDSDLDDHWNNLMYHFNEVNKDFFKNLKAKYDSLTTRDLKLCAYLRMNLSTKEIALLANVSQRGIDASRYRLRKKLNVDAKVNLTEFLMEF